MPAEEAELRGRSEKGYLGRIVREMIIGGVEREEECIEEGKREAGWARELGFVQGIRAAKEGDMVARIGHGIITSECGDRSGVR